MIKLLFVDIYSNVSLSRLPALFSRQGCENFALAPEGQILLKSSFLRQSFHFPGDAHNMTRFEMGNALAIVCQACKPDFLIFSDEALLHNLLRLRARLRAEAGALLPRQQQILDLFENNLLSRDADYRRMDSIEQAAKAGFSRPHGVPVTSAADLPSLMEQMQGPAFLKFNFVAGGFGVRYLASVEDARQAAQESASHLDGKNEQHMALLQKPASGTEHNICFAAWQGRLLGYFVLRPLERMRQYGIASVVAGVYRPQWREALEKFVHQTGFNGFGGMDVFEQPGDELPHVVEVNARPTQSLQLDTHFGGNLIALFCEAAKTGRAPEGPVHHPDNDHEVAFFPYEVLRDAQSPYLVRIPINTPWDDPQILKASLIGDD